jgi:NADH:ubiquinone reductase (H+-translocating)
MDHVVIIGAGFGGLAAAKGLARSSVKVTVIDKTNHHLFQPLLYQVATAGLSATAIAAPTRHVLRKQKNLTVLRADVSTIDLKAKQVLLADGGAVDYDYLIVAAGATHSYFGKDEWAERAPGLKTLADAHHIRTRVLDAFEKAEAAAATTTPLRFIVIGAGPTGVEMAGTLAEITRHTLKGEFRRFAPATTEIVLMEGGERVLASYSKALSASAKKQLESLGVKVCLGARVNDIDQRGVHFSQDGQQQYMAATQVIWAAGVQASPLAAQLAKDSGSSLDKAGRIEILADLTLPNHPDVFVIGDMVSLRVKGQAVPGIAPAAKQMGQYAAQAITARRRKRKLAPFAYQDYGSMATIGRHRAIASIGRFEFSGTPAWLLWLFAHVFFLIGFRNRLAVLIDWAWQYWTMERHARIYS